MVTQYLPYDTVISTLYFSYGRIMVTYYLPYDTILVHILIQYYGVQYCYTRSYIITPQRSQFKSQKGKTPYRVHQVFFFWWWSELVYKIPNSKTALVMLNR